MLPCERGSIEACGLGSNGDILVPIFGQSKRGQLAIDRRVAIIVSGEFLSLESDLFRRKGKKC